MSDNTTKIVLHVDNDTGKVVKAEQEDTAGNRTEASGNFSDITLKPATSKTSTAQMNWRLAPEPDTSEEDDEAQTKISSDNPPSV